MKDIKGVFRRLETLLTQARWFRDDWEIHNRGDSMQMCKTTWFYRTQEGVQDGGETVDTCLEGGSRHPRQRKAPRTALDCGRGRWLARSRT